ncbi:TPA: DUF3375 family protein [Stenotrophomonas maltophilia]|nr:DUF3375 family protein [Stenotrophomonas maltophilia]
MINGPRERLERYLLARSRHPAWQIVAARRAPLMLSCLQTLFEGSSDGVPVEDAQTALADLFSAHAGNSELDIQGDPAAVARRELRDWIRRSLVIERESRLHATDALESALRFIGSLEGRIMTSTASRLAVVQREIEHLDARLNSDPEARAIQLRQQIKTLQDELTRAEAGHVEVASAQEASEAIRELYTLAVGLRADFRRVEDSWREADQRLRHDIVAEGNHRGAILQTFLDGHDELLQTPEGRVFQTFHLQLRDDVELHAMQRRLRRILEHEGARNALNPPQETELRLLVLRLVKESAVVIRTRSRSERDVRGFLRTGVAAEHNRVGQLLNDVFQAAQHVDWSRQSERRAHSPLPPIAFSCGGLPLVERLRCKDLDTETRRELALERHAADITEVEPDFWDALDGLDREALVHDTLDWVREAGTPVSLVELAAALPPTHDLESLAVWIGMAREAASDFTGDTEQLNVLARDGGTLRFTVPHVRLDPDALNDFAWEP